MTDSPSPDALRRLEKLLGTEKGPLPAGDDLATRAVMRGLLTARQLEEARAELRIRSDRGEAAPTLEALLVERGWLKAEAMEALSRESAMPLPRLARYEFEAPIGEGALAIVYRAQDRELGRTVAIKILKGASSFQDVVRRRFRQEAMALARLSHPNVVAVHDAGEQDGHLYLVLELVEGRPLREHLNGPATLRKRAEILRKVALGVHHAHLQGIIHRDLKPENILLNADSEPKVADFGLAHINDSDAALTRTGARFGTPLYMAPEQVEGNAKEVTSRTDVYSLGAVLYEMLAGSPPHPGKTLEEVYSSILTKDPQPVRALNSSVPSELDAITLKALEKDPARRYSSAEELADDLGRFLSGDPVAARQAGRMERWVRRWRRHPVLTAAAAAAFLALAASGLMMASSARKGRQGEEDLSSALRLIRQSGQLSLQMVIESRRAGAPVRADRLLPPLEAAYGEALTRAPNLAEVEYWMGRLHRALLNNPKALYYQERALAKEPGYAPSLYERTILKAGLYGNLLLREYSAAWVAPRPLRTAAEARGFVIPTAEGVEGSLAEMRGQVEADLTRLKKRLREGAPGIDETLLLAARGIVAHRRGRYEEAAALLKTVVLQNPSLEEAWEGLAESLLSRPMAPGWNEQQVGPWEELERLYTEALSHDRGYVPHLGGRSDVRHLRARWKASRGEDPLPDFAAAEADLTAALAINDAYRFGWMGRGDVRVTRGNYRMARGEDPRTDFDSAEQDFGEALVRAGGPHPATLRRRAMVGASRALYRQNRGEDPVGDFSAAQRDLDQCIRLSPDFFAAWAERGALRLNRAIHKKSLVGDPSEDFKLAATDLDEALRLRRDFGPGWQSRGILRLQGAATIEVVDEARSDLEEATRLEPWDSMAWARRAEATLARARLLEAGQEFGRARKDYAEAVGFLEQAAKADPSRAPSLASALEAARAKAASRP